MTTNPIFSTIEKTVSSHDVVLFMKGTKQAPMCGFSARVSQILHALNVDYHDINILTNPELREGIKQYSDWPTIPQLYIKGEFIGGCDITSEMYASGELQILLKEKGILTT